MAPRLALGMTSLFSRILLTAVLAISTAGALPALAEEAAPRPADAVVLRQEGEAQPADDGTDVVPVAVWTIVAVLLAALVGGVFYLLKRRVGGFPRNPKWVAPISIMESKTFPEEGDFGDAPPPDAHGAHH